MSLARLPFPDPGTPDLRSTAAYLRWMARAQWRTLALGITWGVVWMGTMAVVPAGIGAGVQAASEGDEGGVMRAVAVIAVLTTVSATAGILCHRMAVTNWIMASSRTQQLVTRHAAHLGHELRRNVATGEVVAVTSSDVEKIGGAFDVLARFVGAVVAFFAVVVILMRSSVLIGVVVLVGIPLLGLAVGPLS